MIRIGLIQFPGSNCERETALAVKRAGMEPVEILWNESLATLRAMDGYVLIGGFSYEDRSRAGIIAALQPVMQEIKAQSEAGKPVLGLCNGAQILVESGLVPDLADTCCNMALTENKRISQGTLLGTGFYNEWVYMRLTDRHQHNAFTRHLSETDVIHLPVAHAEGRFIMPETLYQRIEERGLNLFQYCDKDGRIIDHFPVNPNGSMGNLAAVSNAAGNVMAMMPHPERTPNGDRIFTSMRDYIANEKSITVHRVEPVNHHVDVQIYQQPAGDQQCVVQLNITDNHALTVQNTLRRLGFPVTVRRFVHWELECDSKEELRQIRESGVLYCDRKERECQPVRNKKTSNVMSYLVRAREDMVGQEALQTLTAHYGLTQTTCVRHGVLWQFGSETADIAAMMDEILLTNIIGNQYAHDYYYYDHAVS
ncbi:phosphoribosylformylglycinamidine synthase I [Legionella spiritensis]|uniref:phosphoribosylformylglycinamidine synthase I n=1 Tax=Legionella spiritensis TaxID=452 RepID=UPI000F6E1D66|nr:phosphoribosylformylglycinamidine synthase I [Legionella spiritensis]VEG90833.1 phosphoribosylformylglycinamidine synthase I (FGAM synthase I) [Legionella spiritensis]